MHRIFGDSSATASRASEGSSHPGRCRVSRGVCWTQSVSARREGAAAQKAARRSVKEYKLGCLTGMSPCLKKVCVAIRGLASTSKTRCLSSHDLQGHRSGESAWGYLIGIQRGKYPSQEAQGRIWSLNSRQGLTWSMFRGAPLKTPNLFLCRIQPRPLSLFALSFCSVC